MSDDLSVIAIVVILVVLYIANSVARTALNTRTISNQNKRIIELLETISNNNQ